jgi:hypothetical protein
MGVGDFHRKSSAEASKDGKQNGFHIADPYSIPCEYFCLGFSS